MERNGPVPNFGEDGVDTVTPLDGDGHNVTGLDEQFETTANVQQEDYETKGRTTVATRRGYRFVPTNKDLPVVTSTGLKVTAEEAEALVSESKGLVSIVTNDENKED